MSALHLACAVEGTYLPHCATMLHSVLADGGRRELHVHLTHGPDLSRRGLERLRRWLDGHGAALTTYDVPDAWSEGMPTRGFTGKATWYRLFLPDLLGDVDRVLFLDADTIVRDDLGPLWAEDLSDAYLAAVTNVFEPMYAHRPAELGLPATQPYFNAGVLLMNLALLREDGCAERMRAYAVEHAERLLWRDQDVLNLVLGHRRRPLEPRWNVMNIFRFEDWSREVFSAEALDHARAHPAIRHFEGPGVNKPWAYGCDDRDRQLYLAHRGHTPWPRLRPERAWRGRTRRLAGGLRRRLAPLRP